MKAVTRLLAPVPTAVTGFKEKLRTRNICTVSISLARLPTGEKGTAARRQQYNKRHNLRIAQLPGTLSSDGPNLARTVIAFSNQVQVECTVLGIKFSYQRRYPRNLEAR